MEEQRIARDLKDIELKKQKDEEKMKKDAEELERQAEKEKEMILIRAKHEKAKLARINAEKEAQR